VLARIQTQSPFVGTMVCKMEMPQFHHTALPGNWAVLLMLMNKKSTVLTTTSNSLIDSTPSLASPMVLATDSLSNQETLLVSVLQVKLTATLVSHQTSQPTLELTQPSELSPQLESCGILVSISMPLVSHILSPIAIKMIIMWLGPRLLQVWLPLATFLEMLLSLEDRTVLLFTLPTFVVRAFYPHRLLLPLELYQDLSAFALSSLDNRFNVLGMLLLLMASQFQATSSQWEAQLVMFIRMLLLTALKTQLEMQVAH
jgi:hypothetical protein